jgi:hypothetical protein
VKYRLNDRRQRTDRECQIFLSCNSNFWGVNDINQNAMKNNARNANNLFVEGSTRNSLFES